MPKDGTVALQPTALVLKQAPSSTAIMHAQSDPVELSIILRHVPQPEQLVKQSLHTAVTYQAFLVNTIQNTKILIGSIPKYRAGTYQLFAEQIPAGYWNQVVVSVGVGNTSELGTPIFEASIDFSPTEEPSRYHTLPADAQRCDGSDSAKNNTGSPILPAPSRPVSPPETKPPIPSTTLKDQLLQPGIVLSEPDQLPFSTASTGDVAQDESGLLQPGTVLPEGDLERTDSNTPPSISDFIAPQLPNHSLWLIYYEGYQLVGYMYHAPEPKKPVYIVHGIPGAYTAQEKPREEGYDYWIPNPGGKCGYWLRYATPEDSIIAHPYPVPPVPQ